MALTHWQAGHRQVLVSHKPGAITVSLTESELVTYDLAGRFLGAYDHGTNIRRGLDNTFQKRWRVGAQDGQHLRQSNLTAPEANTYLEGLRVRVAGLLEDQAAAQSHPATAQALKRAVGFTYGRLVTDAATFTGLYGHIPILPPDQYRALVVQATDGCSYNRCTFCTLYRDKTYQVRSAEDFRRHLEAVLGFMGRGLSYRISLFLGDANAIAIPTPRLVEIMHILHDTALLRPILERGGIHAFLDIYTGRHKSAADYRRLHALGLRRVSLGVESGSEALLSYVQKPVTRQDMVSVMTNLKNGGLAVVVIFMVGLGGSTYRDVHLTESAALVETLPLSKGDVIYLSQFTPDPQAPYRPLAAESGLQDMTSDEISRETKRWKGVLEGRIAVKGVKVAPYSFQRFIY